MSKEIDYNVLNIDPDILAKAWDGDAASQLLLGKAYFNAVYAKDNCSNAFKWFQLSAEQENMEAQLRLADLFALGQEIPKSYTDAYEWYTKSALQGYKKALIRIFNLYQQDKMMYCRGQLDSEEDERADFDFQEDISIRELNEYRLKLHESKLSHAIDYYTKLFNLLKSGNQDDPSVLLKLGFLYQYGFGVKKCIKLSMDYYKEAASQESRDAQYNLGYLYENETDIKFHYYFALRWYRASATSGNVAAQNSLGYFYEKGLGTELNFEGAIYWYTMAANAGNSDAQLTLGKLYRKGNGVDADISEAIKWYTLATNQGNGAAQNCLNQLYQSGIRSQFSAKEDSAVYVGKHQTKPTLRSKLQDDIEKLNNSSHITQLKKLAEYALRTDGNAMFTLGMKYYNGEDFTQDKEAGFQWIKRAAKAGLQKAELKVAEMYETGGNVVDQDFHESGIWTIKLVKQKNSVAQCNLGFLYLSGEGVRKDPLEASKWFTKSADQGNAEAQYQFGLLRSEGLGLRKNVEEAVKWFHKSALNGNIDALYELGKVYQAGEHVEKDIDKAIKLYQNAASKGSQNAHLRLAEIYENGEIADQDLQTAEKYYKLAAESDPYHQYELAKKYMDGAFGNSDYTKAFELFKKIAYEDPSSYYNVLHTPFLQPDSTIDYMKMMSMFKLVSEQGDREICYNIGYLYENGLSYSSKLFLVPNLTHVIPWYLTAIENGDSRANCRLGVMYEEGKGVEVDLAVAYSYYSEACENGIDDAAYRLALMYMNGKYVGQDLIKAYCLFTEVSNKGHKEAFKKLIPSEISNNLKMLEAVANTGYIAVQYQLGVFYQNQKESDGKAIKWLTLASKGGVTDATYRLGVMHEGLKGGDQSLSEAIRLYSEATERDHEEAMYRLARIYHLGRGVEYDYQKAYNLYARAAELGHDDSSRLLDITNYPIGQHSEDLNNSLSIIQYMAKKGNVDLQYILGIFYITNKDRLYYNEAFKWFRMAASKQNTNAIYQLGLLYENGQGTMQSYSTAYRLYSQAKEKGHRESIYRLGIAYQYGLDIEINTFEAIACYSKAAELGNNESQYKLGKLYGSGELVGKDSLQSLKWYTKAYLNGNCDVINDLYQLYDEEPLESFFYERLFKITSNIENTYKLDDWPSRSHYGSVYTKLGLLYLNGQGVAKNLPVALKQFLKAYYDYEYADAEAFLSLEYNPYEVSSQSIYLAKLEAYRGVQDQIPSERQYQLGMIYCNGIQGISINYGPSGNPGLFTVLAPDYSIALRYFNLASLKNHAKAQDQLGLMYRHGYGVKSDYRKALEWFTMASESMGYYNSSNRGKDFYYGNTVDEDHGIAAVYFQRAVEVYGSEAQRYLDSVYLRKIEIEQQDSETMDQFDNEVEDMAPSSLYHRGFELYEQSPEGIVNHNLPLFYIRKAAKKNHTQAFVQLGIMYLEGKAIEKDENEAIRWIEKSIEIMDPGECYEQGMYFYNDMNFKISLRYMKKAAEGNNRDAQGYLSLMYFGGLGIEKNHKQAMKWFQKSIVQFDSYGCYRKGMEFYESVDLDNNYEIALLYLKKAAEENHPSAQVQLGIMYLQGVGVEKNVNKAMEWMGSSIGNQMNGRSCFNLGMIFYNGIEVGKNYDIALAFLQKAADRNHGLALAQLGLMYLDGHGVSENEYEAMQLIEKSLKNMSPNDCYKVGIHLYNQYESERHLGIAWIFINKAAKEGHGLAQALLGEMYLEGKGVRKNQDEASKWIENSAGNLKSDECYNQAMKYYNGFDIEKNHKIAMLYLQMAEHKKYTPAQVQIGIMYLESYGIEKSEVKAMEYFQQSINNMDLKGCYHQGILFYNTYHYDISLLYIRRAAGAGYGPAQSQLGILLLGGKAIQKNQTNAMFWIEKSIESMTPFDCYKQGMALYRGLSVVKDYIISLRFMEKAAANHYGPAQAQAQAHLAMVYYQGLGVKKNRNEAMKWVERSLKYLGPDECYEQGVKFYNETEVDPDYETTLLYIQKAIESHHGPSQAQLALMYLEGSGVVKNYDTAMYWIEKSMNGMKLDECYRQGMLFYHRKKLENNYDIALRYFKKASKANAYAQAQLGYMYLNGIGVEQDHDEAVRWHSIVENNYIGDSRYCRSKIYHCDQNGMQDFSKVFKLYQEELGFIEDVNYTTLKYTVNHDALRGVGLLYEYGDGVTQDFKKALEYYGRSASDENKATYYSIGLLYYYGKGVDQNHKEALFWFTKVADADINPQQSHVFVEDNGDDSEGETTSSKRTYSLQPYSRIYGEVHYYIGLMYNSGFFVDHDEERAQNYFKMAHLHGVERANNLLK